MSAHRGPGNPPCCVLLAGGRDGGRPDDALHLPDNLRAGSFMPLRSQKALIELLGSGGIRAALDLMGLVGLSDAFIYLKRFEELSNGQQYRAMLAQMIASNRNLWLADEFCSSLDVLTANVVADRLQRLARQFKAAVVVASSQPDAFVNALRPDKVVRLTTAWEHQVMSGADFLEPYAVRDTRFPVPNLLASDRDLSAVRGGNKRRAIRKGHLSIAKGLLLLRNHSETLPVNVTEVRHVQLQDLTEDDAKQDGCADLSDLHRALRHDYPSLAGSTWLTIMSFAPLRGFETPSDHPGGQ